MIEIVWPSLGPSQDRSSYNIFVNLKSNFSSLDGIFPFSQWGNQTFLKELFGGLSELTFKQLGKLPASATDMGFIGSEPQIDCIV